MVREVAGKKKIGGRWHQLATSRPAIFREGVKNVAPARTQCLCSAALKGDGSGSAELERVSRKVKKQRRPENVASVSANNDRESGRFLKAMEKVGKDAWLRSRSEGANRDGSGGDAV